MSAAPSTPGTIASPHPDPLPGGEGVFAIPSGGSRKSRWLPRLGLLLIGLLLPVLALELVLRQFGPILPGNYRTGSLQARDPVYGRVDLPNFDGWIRSPEFVAQVKTNSLGLRDDEVLLPKPPGTFRILVLGDSFVEGTQVRTGQPFTEVLERVLNGLPPHSGRPERYDVVNAGVGGWGPAEEYLWLRNEGLKLQPDLVILQLYLGNDISDAGCKILGQDEFKHKVCFYFDRNGELYQDELRPRSDRESDPARSMLRRISVLYNVLETGVFEKVDSEGNDGRVTNWQPSMNVYAKTLSRRDQQEWDEAWRIAAALVGKMKDETEASGARFVLTAAPSVFQVYPEEWVRAVAENRRRPDQWDLERPNQRFGELARALGVTHLDLGPALKAEANTAPALYYRRDGHFTPAGHEVMARELQAFLLANGLVP